MVKLGCVYTLCTNRRTVATVKILDYNPIDKMHKVARIDNMENTTNECLKHYTLHRNRGTNKSSSVYLYMCDIGNGFYKLGVSCSPSNRCNQKKMLSKMLPLNV